MDKIQKEMVETLVTMFRNLFIKLMIGFFVTVCVITISFSVSVCYSQQSSNRAMTEWFRLYMETDYEYPGLDIQQTVDQDIGVN